MFELTGISQKIIKDFYQAIEKTLQKDNWDKIFFVAVKGAMHSLIPGASFPFIEPYAKKLIKEISDYREQLTLRDFVDDNEAVEVFHNTFKSMDSNLSDSELIDTIYDLLEYDKVIIYDNEKYLASVVYLVFWMDEHEKAYKSLRKLKDNKPAEMNYTTSTNTLKAPRDKVKFLKASLQLQISHPYIESTLEEKQMDLLDLYGEEHHAMARSIHCIHKLKNDLNVDEPNVNAVAKLKHHIDSDGTIEYKNIYISWHAHCFGIYKRISKKKIPVKKLLKVAKLYSYEIFPELKGKKLLSESTVKKPVRESGFFDGLRLLDFSDSRHKIKRTDEDIKDTETYMKEFIRICNR